MNYNFDLVAKRNSLFLECGPGLRHGDSCHVEVYDQLVMEGLREINWDKTTCPRKNQHQDNNGGGE